MFFIGVKSFSVLLHLLVNCFKINHFKSKCIAYMDFLNSSRGSCFKFHSVLTSINEIIDRHSGSVVECPLFDREVAGSMPCRVIPKTLKMVLAALSLGIKKVELGIELVSSVSV